MCNIHLNPSSNHPLNHFVGLTLCTELSWDSRGSTGAQNFGETRSSRTFKMDISVFRLSYKYPAACILAATELSCLFEGDLRIAKRHYLWQSLWNNGNDTAAVKKLFKCPIHILIHSDLRTSWLPLPSVTTDKFRCNMLIKVHVQNRLLFILACAKSGAVGQRYINASCMINVFSLSFPTFTFFCFAKCKTQHQYLHIYLFNELFQHIISYCC